MAIFRYVEIYYNPNRLYSTRLDYQSPDEFEKTMNCRSTPCPPYRGKIR